MNIREKVLSGFLWSGGTRIVSQALSWAITIVVIRILSPADYGLLAMATVFTEFFLMMSQFGIGTAVVQARELDERTLRQILGFCIVVNGLLFAVLFVAAPLVAVFFENERLTAIVRTLAVPFLLGILGIIPSAQLGRRLDYKTISLIGFSGTVLASVATLALALAGAGVWALVWGTLTEAIWRTVVVNIVSPFIQWPIFSLRGMRKLVLFGGNLTLARILWFWYSQSDVIIAGKVLGKDLLGAYSVAMHLANLPAAKLSSLVNQVAFPAFARVQDDRVRYAGHFLLAVRVLSLGVFPVLWGMSSVAPELVHVVLGEKWDQAVVPLQLLALIMPVHMFGPFMNTAANAIGRTDVSMRHVLTAAVVMPVAFIIGSQWGLKGLAASWVIAFPLVFAVAIRLVMPVLGLRARDFLSAMMPATLAAAGMYAAVTAVRLSVGPGMAEAELLAVLVLAGVVSYAAFTGMFNRRGVMELIQTLKG